MHHLTRKRQVPDHSHMPSTKCVVVLFNKDVFKMEYLICIKILPIFDQLFLTTIGILLKKLGEKRNRSVFIRYFP